jgi:hypothetical protein
MASKNAIYPRLRRNIARWWGLDLESRVREAPVVAPRNRRPAAPAVRLRSTLARLRGLGCDYSRSSGAPNPVALVSDLEVFMAVSLRRVIARTNRCRAVQKVKPASQSAMGVRLPRHSTLDVGRVRLCSGFGTSHQRYFALP